VTTEGATIMTTTTATPLTGTSDAIAEDAFVIELLGDGDDSIAWSIDAPNGLWTVTYLDGDDFLVEGPSHHFEDVVLEGLDMASDYVRMMGVDRRRSAAK
jgi:hypothetical protein